MWEIKLVEKESMEGESILEHTLLSVVCENQGWTDIGFLPDSRWEYRATLNACTPIFKPPPPVGAGGGYMFSGRPSVPLSVRACICPSVRDSHGSFMFPRYLQYRYLLTDFCQTFVTGASRDRDELIRFWGQKVKVQGHTIAAEAHSTWRYCRVQLFLVGV